MQKQILMFTSRTCQPCKQAKIALKEHIEKDAIKVIEVSDSQKDFDKYKVKSVPTFVFLTKGEETDRVIGYSQQTLNKLNEFLI